MSTNEITGDALRTKPASDAYRDNFDGIDFSAHRKPEAKEEQEDAPGDIQKSDD